MPRPARTTAALPATAARTATRPVRRARAALAAPFAPRALAALLHALVAPVLALPGAVLVLVGLGVGAVLSWTALGPWLLALTVRGALALGDLQRALAGSLSGEPVEAAGRRSAPGVFGWRRALLGDPAGWRAVAAALLAPFTALPPLLAVTLGYVYGVLALAQPVLRHWNYFTVHDRDGTVRHVGLLIDGVEFDSWPRWTAVVAAGALLVLLAPRLVRWAGAPHRLLLRALLGPSAADARIRTLEETRAHAVEDAAATLRRIERDLHDGTQARLVGLGMQLTLIRELLTRDADRDRLLTTVAHAQDNATRAIADLRHLVRGIHPPALDEGLETALATLAADAPLPVALRARISHRPSPALESIAYFCAAELLANAVKHSGAAEAAVEVRGDDRALRLSVRDDGRGGAVIGAGSGLTGLLGRIRTVDGTLTCDSPPGGPTVAVVHLPYPTAYEAHPAG
ncbi:sensor histidine kinase [Streptomyces noursei]|uniref:sensor histidine kinase n=1 Tax=Streptomyces noursei TaxID=1971 RepID=UPI00167BC3EF|nr:sensor domain-containing protein [Streptomyces noursei]MCZ1015696.1 sensor domain-containing protein [Streptomyces noursei]GGW90094.1 histidine kinase [Streptomyces noursei]